MSVFNLIDPTPGLTSLPRHTQDLRAVRSQTSEEQIAAIKATLEAQRQRLEQKRFKSPELFKDSAAAFQLRNRFQQALNRLDHGETRERAVGELRSLIDKNRSEEALKVITSSLSEFKKSRSAKGREQEALLVGFLADIYGPKLADSTLSPMHYLIKLREILLALFGDLHGNVREAAADSWCALYVNCVPKEDIRVVFETVYEPLYAILLSGVDVKAQQGASLALFKWTQSIAESNNVILLRELTPRILSLYTKLRPEYPDLISALGILIENVGLQDCMPELQSVLGKTVQYLRSRDHGAFTMKVEACKLLKLLGEKLQKVVDIIIGFSTQEVLAALIDTKSDKVPVVQSNARTALEQWQLLARLQARVEEDKMQMENMAGEELIKHRTGLAELPRLVKERTATLELPVALQDQFSDFRRARDAVKRRKEAKITVIKETPQPTRWGVMKPKYLVKGTGHYTSIPVGVTETPTFEPISHSRAALPPYTPMPPPEPVTNINRDLLKAIIKSAPQKRPEPLTTEQLLAQVKSAETATAKTVSEGLERVGAAMHGVEKRTETIERKVATLQEAEEETPDFAREDSSWQAEPSKRASSKEDSKDREDSRSRCDSVTQMWLRALESYTQGDLDTAYRILLEAGDDVYLMRMLHKSGICLDALRPATAASLMRRLGLLLSGFIIPDAVIEWCSEAASLGLLSQVQTDTRDSLLEDLKAVSATEAVGEGAKALLEVVEKSA